MTLQSSYHESSYHKKSKLLLLKRLISSNYISRYEFEKIVGERRIDLYLKLTSGEKVAIEVQNSVIPIREILERTRYYTSNDFYTLWLLNPRGHCVVQEKYPADKSLVKISSLEKCLFQLYGGRVYYLDLNGSKHDPLSLFALYFAIPYKRKYRKKRFRTRFYTYWIRNSHHVKIPSLGILCTKFNGYKIARFYDKNFLCSLKGTILTKSNRMKNKAMSEKKKARRLKKDLYPKYGKFLVQYALTSLIYNGKLSISKRRVRRFIRKYYLKYRGDD